METKTTAELAARLGAQISFTRNAQHLSLEQLCEKVNNQDPDTERLSPEVLATIEAGTENVSSWMMLRIFYELGYEIGLFKK